MRNVIFVGDALDWLGHLPSESVDCVVTSPPYYGLRDYGVDGQLGLEETPEAYIANLVSIFDEVWRVLNPMGTVWLNLGDSYWANRSKNGDTSFLNTPGQNIKVSASHARDGGPSHELYKPKDLLMIPHRVALALQAAGWWVRSDIVWHKPSCMPESVKDRPTKAHEYVFLLSKSAQYFYDADAIRENHSMESIKRAMRANVNNKYSGDAYLPEKVHANTMSQKRDYMGYINMIDKVKSGETSLSPNGRNKRSVWSISPKGYTGSHFATMPIELAATCIKAGCPRGGVVLDMFGGAGTTAVAAVQEGRDYCLIELNVMYAGLAQARIQAQRVALQNADPMQSSIVGDMRQLSLFEAV